MAIGKTTEFERAFGDARTQAGKVADTTTAAAKHAAGSFEKALRDTIENKPYKRS